MGRFPEPLVGGEHESEEEQRLKLLELVRKYLHGRFGALPAEDDATAEVSPESVPEHTPEERIAKVAMRPRTQEDINRDLERIGISVRILLSEEDRVHSEVDAWLDRNQMTPRTALIYVEELVAHLREKQVGVSEPEVRKHLWGKMHRR